MASLLATYLLHSTVILLSALLLVQLPGLRRASARDILLRTALLAGLLTPLGQHYLARTFVPVQTRFAAASTSHGDQLTPSKSVSPDVSLSKVHGTFGPIGLGKLTGHLKDRIAYQRGKNQTFYLFLFSGLLVTVRFGLGWKSLKRLSSRGLLDARLLELLESLDRFAHNRRVVKLLSVPDLGTPLAFGRRTVLFPSRLVTSLAPGQAQAVLAHELTHLWRHDPLWNMFLSFVAHLFFFQPLNFIVLCAWRQASEEICDASAVECTGNPLILAQCLLNVTPGPTGISLAMASGMATRTHLSRRVEALVNPKEYRMKRPYLVLVALLPLLLGATVPTLTFVQSAESGGLEVVIDAGHGGSDSGGTGYAEEDIVVLQVAQKVKNILEASNVRVIITRDKDAYLELAARVNRVTPSTNALISIHAQASENPDLRGVETWMANSFSAQTQLVDSNKVSATLALAKGLQTKLVAATGSLDRGIKTNTFNLLQSIRVPAVLVNIGFVTNAQEGQKLVTENYQHRLAAAIASSVLTYLQK